MNRAKCAAVFVAGMVACASGAVWGQQASTGTWPAFDVVSVKRIDRTTSGAIAASIIQAARQSGSPGSLTLEHGGRWLVRGATLRTILQSVYPAYSRPGLIIGGPAWIDQLQFEIDARAPERSTPEEIGRMAKRLLAERFKLQVRTAMHRLDIYALTLIRDDKRLGRGMRPPIECDQEATFGPDGRPIPGPRPRCQLGLNREDAVMLLSGGAAHIAELITWLQMTMDRPIVDRTGLTGQFAIRLELPPVLPAARGTFSTSTSDMTTAVREQLGLRLVPRTEPTTVLRIDHVEMPEPN